MTKFWKITVASSFAMITAGVLVLGCGGDDKGGKGKTGGGDTGQGSTAAAAFPADKTTGSITGKVSYKGEETKPKYHRIVAVPLCEKHHKGKLIRADFELAKDGGLPNVFIEVLGLEWKFDVPKKAVTIDQVNCEYVPHVVAIMVGQDLVVTSSDAGVQHNVKWEGKKNSPSKKNFTINKGEKVPLVGKNWKKPESARFQCSIHPWMSCEFHVVKHPVFTVSDKNGNFTLPKLPDGKYEVEFTHAKRGTQKASVTISGSDPKPLKIEFK